MILTRSPRRPRKQKRWPLSGSRAAKPPGPAATATESPCAYRCDRSPATPARRPERGSWSLSPIQEIEDAFQRAHVGAGPDPNPSPVRKLDFDAAIGAGCFTGAAIAARLAALR